MKKRINGLLALLLVLITQITFAQDMNISGVVSDSNGLPIPGANVKVKGTSVGTSTDFDGSYKVKAKSIDVLVYSFQGMNTVELKVSGVKMNCRLASKSTELEGVVVVGYGKQDKRKMVQSVTVVNSDRFKDVNVASAQDILQGQASGVQVINSSGLLGSAPVIKIRGVASLSAGGRPLIVLDGIPLNDENLTAAQGGQSLNPLANINQNDIESMTVLKDASATAIYGSRGSNGVILITTKSGKKNQATKITVGFNTSVTQATDLLNVMNADQYREFRTKVALTPITPTQIGLDSFDWVNAVKKDGISIGSDVNIVGGSETSTYAISGTYADQEGFIIGNGLRRNGARINFTNQANRWLKVGINLGVSEVLNDRVGSENNTNAPFTSAYLQLPVISAFDANGNLVRSTNFIPNVLAIEKFNINDSNTFRLTGNVFSEIKFNDNLNLRTDFGIDRDALEEFRRDVEINTPGGFASNYQAVQSKYVFTNALNFNKKFNTDHELSGVIGGTVENTSRRDVNVAGTGFASDDLTNITSAVTKTITESTTTANRLVGLFSRVNYGFKNKYLFESSFRRDGSSRFGEQNRYGNFWAIGGAWVVSAEEFLKNNNILSFLKFKANFGTAGNDRLADFGARENTSGNLYPNYNATLGLVLRRFPNPNLKWELSEALDLGVELGMFDNRVKLNIEYYVKTTKDLILPQSLSVAENLGINVINVNAGTMENRGFDIDFSVDILRKSALKWSANINFNFNKNKVLSLNESAGTDIDGNKFIIGSVSQRAIVGQSVNTFFLIPYLGINPQTGDAEWQGRDGLPTKTPVANDRVIVGDANPDFTGGLNNTFQYKNFDLSTLVNFSYGNEIFIDGLRFTQNPNRTNGFNKDASLLNVWQNPGDIADTPAKTSTTFNTAFAQRSTKQLRDGSFARLKNITIGYNLDFKNTSVANFLKGIRFYFTAQNLVTFKKTNLNGIDPEVTNSIDNGVQGETFFTAPQAKTYLFGTRLTF